jgi:hypothetical protein
VNGAGPADWRQRLLSALALLLATAYGLHVAAELLEPLVPALIVLAVLSAVLWFAFGRRRR